MTTTPVVTGRTLGDILERMGAFDLDTRRERRPDLWMVHPRSGFMVRTTTPRPVVHPRGDVPEIVDEVPGPMGMGEQIVPGSGRPPRYLAG